MFIRVKRTAVRKTRLEFEVSWCGRRWRAITAGIAKTWCLPWAKARGVRERELGSWTGSRPAPARAPDLRR